MVIRPLAYRKSAGRRLQYRQPAYLICTDPAMSPAQLLQAYVAPWEIEVNFREQKTVMGLGQACTARSAQALPCFLTGVYSLLLLAGERLARRHGPDQLSLPRPKWYPIRPGNRFATGDLLGRWRAPGQSGDF